MNVDMNAMKAEIGGAFLLSWMVFGRGLGTLEGEVALAVVWMAFSGAHVLPVVTWSHRMTGNLGDTDGNQKAHGMRLAATDVGALLGIMTGSKMCHPGTGLAARYNRKPRELPPFARTCLGHC